MKINRALSPIKKIVAKARYGLVLQVLQDRLAGIGIDIAPFYWMEETLPDIPPPLIKGDPADYEFSFFGLEDIKIINDLPERQVFNPQVFLSLFSQGKKCYGVKFKNKIAAFTWINLDESNSRFYRVDMKDNEAYLGDMYVLKAFRGRNIAPVLRYKTYQALKEIGRDTCYSITECFNTPSLRFKQKLHARILFKGLFIDLFKKFRKIWILRRY